GLLPDHRAALREPAHRAPAPLHCRRAHEPHAVHLPDDPDHGRDRRRGEHGRGGRGARPAPARGRPHARLHARPRARLRRARARGRDERVDVRRDLEQPVALLHDGERARRRRARDARRPPRAPPHRPHRPRLAGRERRPHPRRLRDGRGVGRRGRPLLRPGDGRRPHLGRHHQERRPRLPLPLHLLGGDVHPARRRRALRRHRHPPAARRHLDALGQARLRPDHAGRRGVLPGEDGAGLLL
ncbi:MAG: Cytochrome c-type biogenesis protein DsbD, protein-disulfide reductase, partial [uncultured Gemmatimonadaceae bacterium]